MSLAKYSLQRTFFTHSKFNARIPEQSGIFRDKIYKAMTVKELSHQGYSRQDLKHAIQKGWLKETYISQNGSTIIKAYLWLQDELPQYGKFKRIFDRVYRYVTGDYERYY